MSDLDERRRTAKAAIDALLASWDGAGGSEADSTPEWEEAAIRVIDSLSAFLTELDLARHHVRLISQRRGS
jgi:hypothetical protein